MYKYYYELNYFPIPNNHKKEYKKIDAKGKSPKIVKKISSGIYEVDDGELFYTSTFDEFNVLIYTFPLPENGKIHVQVTRYKKIRTSTYSICVKSTELIPGVECINVEFNSDILKPVTFDINKYGRMEDPAYLVKKDGTTIDIISIGEKVYAVNSNYGSLIGTQKSSLQLFVKGELMDHDNHHIVYIFDAFIINGEALDISFKERMKRIEEYIPNISINTHSHIKKIVVSNIHESFENAYQESQSETLKEHNDGIIIQGPFDEPLKWKPGKSNTIDVLVEDDLYLNKGLDQILTFKVVKNPAFNMKVIWDYRNKYSGEIIEIGIDGSFHRIRYDKLKPNAIRTYRASIETSTTIDKDILLDLDSKLAPYIFNSYKEMLLDKYVHGETVELNVNCGVINKINTLLESRNISASIDQASNFGSCQVENKIAKSPHEYLESERLQHDTFIVDLPGPSNQLTLDFLLGKVSKLLKPCGKIILFDSHGQLANLIETIVQHDQLEILETFKLSNIPNKEIFPKTNLELYNAVILRNKEPSLKPDFVFVVGLMGSGKSRLINQIRNFIHPSSALHTISIDAEVLKYISYQLYADIDTYKEIRRVLDPIIDKKINSLIASKQSLLLETTHIDEKYATEIEKTHKTIAVICNTDFSQIEMNIEMRNKVNIRKTDIDKERYQKFQNEISTYPKFINSVYLYDMHDTQSSNEKIKELTRVKGGIPDKRDGIDFDDLVEGGEGDGDSLIENLPERKIYLKLSDLTQEQKYEEKFQHPNKGVHYGQRKLLITEIMFLTMFADPDKVYNVIYAGSAPSIKYPVLRELFKNCRFILIDPNPYSENVLSQPHLYFKGNFDSEKIKINSHIRTVIINDLCTMDLIEKLAHLGNILFISDIRTNLLANAPTEYDILFNVAQHKSWLDILYNKDKDLKYMLKSRCIFTLDQTEHFDNFIKLVGEIPEWKLHGQKITEVFKSGNLLDIDGEIYIQPWKGTHSTEVRIVGNNPEWVERKCISIESKLFYYNVNLRISDEARRISGIEAFGFTDEDIKSNGVDVMLLKDYCGCNDCGIEIHWIKEYAKKYQASYNRVIGLINRYSQSIKTHKTGESKVHVFENNNSKKAIAEESLYKNEFV